jgi:hypothetical protein
MSSFVVTPKLFFTEYKYKIRIESLNKDRGYEMQAGLACRTPQKNRKR